MVSATPGLLTPFQLFVKNTRFSFQTLSNYRLHVRATTGTDSSTDLVAQSYRLLVQAHHRFESTLCQCSKGVTCIYAEKVTN